MPVLQEKVREAFVSWERLMDEVYEAGRAAGREEAATDLRAKLASVLNFDAAPAAATEEAARRGSPEVNAAPTEARDPVEPVEGRAAPGSVKPVLLRLIQERPGITRDELVAITGFKFNSVRGTLWSLSNEKLVQSDKGHWFPFDPGRKGANAITLLNEFAREDQRRNEGAQEKAVDDTPGRDPSTASDQPEAQGGEARPGGGA